MDNMTWSVSSKDSFPVFEGNQGTSAQPPCKYSWWSGPAVPPDQTQHEVWKPEESMNKTWSNKQTH